MGIKWGILALSALLWGSALQAQEPPAPLSPEALRSHVEFLASDELQGRATGSGGYYWAARYAARQLQGTGARPATANESGDSTFLQPFPVTAVAARPSTTSHNVLAVIPGRDSELRDQYVMVGAHLDGQGLRPGGIYNSANDNATGSATVIELARALLQDPPRRSVILALWGAEEVGHVGSRFYVANPPLPLEAMVGHVNLDGIGRYDRSPGDQVKIYALGGANICSAFQDRLVEVGARTGVEFDMEDREGWYPYSDHYHFHEVGIPAVFLTDLGSDDYHRPTDDADRIDYEKLSATGRTALEFTRTIADLDEPVCPSR